MNRDLVDKEVIRRINSGSEEAFSELYRAYYAYLNAIAINSFKDMEIIFQMRFKKQTINFYCKLSNK